MNNKIKSSSYFELNAMFVSPSIAENLDENFCTALMLNFFELYDNSSVITFPEVAEFEYIINDT